MLTMKRTLILTALILGAVMTLNACGTSTSPGDIAGSPVASPANNAGTPPASSAQPDSVRIFDDLALPPQLPAATPPIETPAPLTLSDAALVRQLYATISALPVLPLGRACTAERGPHYTLTFLHGTNTLMTVQADRDGCWPVTIAGETPLREASTTFWQELDQAIDTATPTLNPDRIAVAKIADDSQAPQSALITSAATATRLYDAMLALPQTKDVPSCAAEPVPTYQLVFFQGDQAVPASVYDVCQTVEVDGGYVWRGGWFAMNDQFRSLLQAALAGVTFAPVQPDRLAVSVNTPQTVTPYVTVNDRQLMLALYEQIFQLSKTAASSGCPPDTDKVGGNYTFSGFTFSQWDLPLAQINTYEGSCRYVQLSDTGPRLQGDQAFWDLVDRAQAP